VSQQSPLLSTLDRGAQALGLELSPHQIRRFAILARELIAWNARFNLTSITDPDDVQLRHFLDSLAVAPIVQRELPSRRGQLIDVGSGAGFPGLPLAIALPWLEVTLLEATAKKVRFLEHAVAALGVRNVRALAGRAESVAHRSEDRETYDVAVARAVGSAATLIELLIPLLKVGGIAVVMKTRTTLDVELGQARGALARLSASVEGALETPVMGLDDHVLVAIRKNGSTPAEYPRRPGVPARHPLPAMRS
jgi:16S rRNA (guanine527-N7)-methyltransferase